MPTAKPAVVIVRQDTLFALVANNTNGPAIVLGDVFPVTSLPEERVYGLNLCPALLSSNFREIRGSLVPSRGTKLYLNSMYTNL